MQDWQKQILKQTEGQPVPPIFQIMDKVEFITRLEAAKSALPNSVVPLLLTKYPEYNTYKKKSRVSNVVQGKLQDEEILNKLEALVKLLKPSK